MRSVIYVLVVKNFYLSNGIEYAAAISSQNISLWRSFDEAVEILNQAKEQLLQSQYYEENSLNEDNIYGRQFCVRLAHKNGRAAVLEILRKSVDGVLTTFYYE